MANKSVTIVLEDEIAALNSPAPLAGLLRGIQERHKEPLCSKPELAELKKRQSEFEAIEKRMTAFQDDKVKGEWLRRRDALVKDGDSDRAAVLDRDGVKAEFMARRRAFKDAMAEIGNLCRPVCIQILERLAARGAALADEIEAGERATAARFDARHIPSPAVRALRRLTELKGSLVASSGYASPRSMLQGIVTEL